ncbi:MAG: DUF4214 domain-containing protein [Desulfacinum sp.]|jgi:V8-like Glu-specific endopeptidase|nr:DUF4214 domain-containing protein [Desulfacinum sp.]
MAVLGLDDRTAVEGAGRRAPYASVVQVLSWFQDGSVYQGSGVLVGVDDVLTAAHMLYDPDTGAWARNVLVTPARSGDVKPYGVAWGEQVRVPPGWLDGSYAFDYGHVALTRPVGFFTGWLPVADSPDPSARVGEPLVSLGYPGDWGGDRMVSSAGTPDWVSGSLLYFSDDLDAAPGQSGSPVLDVRGAVVAVISHERAFPRGNAAVTLSPASLEMLREWIREDDGEWTFPARHAGIPYERAAFVTGLYRGLLDRDPDPEGFFYWADRLAEGAGPRDLTAAFLASAEYGGSPRLRTSGEPEKIVESLYRVLLGRDPDPPGAAYWVGLLEEGAPADLVITGFLTSAEYGRRTALDAYRFFHSAVEAFSLESYGSGEGETLPGTDGDDFIYGDGGPDRLAGGDGRDYLWGGPGDDALEGGAGSDFFAVEPGGGRDVVLDFRVEEDFVRWRGSGDDYVLSVTEAGVALVGEDGTRLELVGVTGLELDAVQVIA